MVQERGVGVGKRGRRRWPMMGTMREDKGEGEKCRWKRETQNEGQKQKKINLTLASAKQLEQITPIIQGRCVQELCGLLALWVSEGVLAFINVHVLLLL